MHAAIDRLDFAPPPQARSPRALALAVGAHVALLAALTWGISWTHDAPVVVAEAELWASVPVEAAPKLVEAPPAPPAPEVKPPPTVAPPMPSAADIALEREKKEIARQRKAEMDLKVAQEMQKREEAKKQAELKKQADLKKQAEAKQAAEEKAKLAAAAKVKQEQEDAKQREALRQENLKRMAGLAGATGAPSATGTAQRSAGPSASYAGKIVARVRPNIVFADDLQGNPVTEVEVRAAPDGTIVGRKVVKPSTVKAWDDAVLKAIDKTETLPRDTDGRVPSTLIISFRPKD
jgi:colicin import membrane protein